ncbi:unnamed protein product [Paramecium primaurelia]|uniref:Histidine kinase/HSP90-like ATPase domain-containing protein n=1 Tax=Paramecium primaurelia TaxID=5886 RepID=A0A8S1N9I0_PARPR|nr:unnamed protein product [Paramecium primaurelia]
MEENDALIKSSEPQHTRNIIKALINEYKIMYAGLQNQEYLDYCFIKGASGQTVPLALLLPIGLLLGSVNILSKATTNIIEGDYILTNLVQVILQICGLCIILYLLLKACEVIPKKIQNPLLFGRVTTYIFMCLLITMGILVVERIVDGQARTYHTSQFWVVFVRFVAFLFLYTYYAFRVSRQEFRWIYNLLKASVYIILELFMVINKELKNYADYQLENNIHTKQVIQEVVPPMRMLQQQFLLESYLKVFPVVIFDQTKKILNISSETLKLLGQNDIFQAKKQLRKLEIIEVFYRKEQASTKELTVKLSRQAKFGSSCGVNEKGDLLHSLINGPALQKLRQQLQVDQPSLQTQGQQEKLLNELIKWDQEYLKGLLMLKLSKEKQYYFSFHLFRNNKIYLFLDDVSEIVKLQIKIKDENDEIKDVKDINIQLSEIRQISTIKSYPILTKIQNIEIKSCYLEQNQLRIKYDNINFDQILRILSLTDSKNKILIQKSNEERLRQIIDILMENSIEQTKDGFIGITIENDARPNCIQISIQDTVKGINLDELKDKSSTKLSGLYTILRLVSRQEFRWIYNLLKASVYIILELFMVINKELKNYADYQLENNIHTKQVIQEVVPPMRMLQQQFLLESYLKVFPVVIFDQTKKILNISSETLKLLGQNDIFQAKKQLRKLEIIEVFYRKEQASTKELTVKLSRQAKFGSSCGVNEKGDLLHSLINGPALQKLRQQLQVDQPSLQTQGQQEKLLNELIKWDQEYLKGLLMLKLSKEKQYYFSFHLFRNNKIYLFLDDVSEIVKLQIKIKDENDEIKDVKDINIQLSEIRQISTIKSYPILTKIQNIEIKSCYLEQNQLRIKYDNINFDQILRILSLTDSKNKILIQKSSKIEHQFLYR